MSETRESVSAKSPLFVEPCARLMVPLQGNPGRTHSGAFKGERAFARLDFGLDGPVEDRWITQLFEWNTDSRRKKLNKCRIVVENFCPT